MTELFLKSHGLLPELPSATEVYVVVLGDTQAGATKLAAELRAEGVNTELDITGRKLDKQLKTAIKKGIPYILFVGEEELSKEVYTLKDTASTEEQKLSMERVISTVKDRRHHISDELDDLFQ
jgi:histidyl-tRNA synthetase